MTSSPDTDEQEFTVERCLTELRELFPDYEADILFSTTDKIELTVWESDAVPRRLLMCRADTLAEVMQKVRTWRESQS